MAGVECHREPVDDVRATGPVEGVVGGVTGIGVRGVRNPITIVVRETGADPLCRYRLQSSIDPEVTSSPPSLVWVVILVIAARNVPRLKGPEEHGDDLDPADQGRAEARQDLAIGSAI